MKLLIEVEVLMILSKSFQILDPKYEIDFLDIFFTSIGSTKLSADFLLLQPEKNLDYIYVWHIYRKEVIF